MQNVNHFVAVLAVATETRKMIKGVTSVPAVLSLMSSIQPGQVPLEEAQSEVFPRFAPLFSKVLEGSVLRVVTIVIIRVQKARFAAQMDVVMSVQKV